MSDLKVVKNDAGQYALREMSGVIGQIVQRRAESGELRWHYYLWSERKLSQPFERKDSAVRAARRVWRSQS